MEITIKSNIVPRSTFLKQEYQKGNFLVIQVDHAYISLLKDFLNDYPKLVEKVGITLSPWEGEVTPQFLRFFWACVTLLAKETGEATKEYKNHIHDEVLAVNAPHIDNKTSIKDLTSKEMWICTQYIIKELDLMGCNTALLKRQGQLYGKEFNKKV